MKKKSLFFNSIIYTIKSLIGVLIPFISFPLVTRILGPDNYGKVSYANSIVNYFIYFAALGITTYAIREGAKYRNDKDKLSKLSKELLIINIISTLIAYIGIFIILQIDFFSEYFLLIVIHSFIIIFQTFGMEWLFQIKEDFTYISIRHIIFQVIGLIFLAFFMKDKDDYLIYAIYTVFTTCADNIINIFRIPKYINIARYHKLEIKKHIKPLFLIFSISIVSTIYQNIDTTMLGLILTNKDVGFYNSALRLYNIISTIIASLSTVMFARSTYIINEDHNKFINLIYQFSQYLFLISIPMTIGLICVGDLLIEFFCGSEYQSAGIVLQIYSLNIFISTINRIFGHQILIVKGKEKIYSIATLISCIINILINLLLIEHIGIIACSISSVIGTLISAIIIVFNCKRYLDIVKVFKLMVKPVLMSIPFLIINYLSRLFLNSLLGQILIIVGCSIIIYSILSFILYKKDIKILVEGLKHAIK